ncbi:diguanylate cyclase [Thiohalophilus sp.]|uniref:sensor domain-containing diguanylate cyclase n=1 Tax=Thiohalophilus sp. TaxID=3028392 RepID=UPI00397548A3
MNDRDDGNLAEMHWLLRILQDVDVGLVVLDRKMRVQLWNGFMENHSGLTPGEVRNQNLFSLFPELPEAWLVGKIESVFLLNNRAFSTWNQRPYLFRFNSYHPITGNAEFMYQNSTIIPLISVNGEVEQVCLIIYDVTDTAIDEQALQQANKELARLGQTDGLTGLYNRRAWEELLSAEFKRSERSGMKSVLVMFDIDHFKKVNDSYGHQAGDEVIRQVAESLRQVKREVDIAGRYGGEEFGVILVDTDIDGGLHFAERLRRAIEQSVVSCGSTDIRFTISLGLAENGQQGDYVLWLEQADQALYHAKKNGRNRASVFGVE